MDIDHIRSEFAVQYYMPCSCRQQNCYIVDNFVDSRNVLFKLPLVNLFLLNTYLAEPTNSFANVGG